MAAATADGGRVHRVGGQHLDAVPGAGQFQRAGQADDTPADDGDTDARVAVAAHGQVAGLASVRSSAGAACTSLILYFSTASRTTERSR